jgi:hypothetical protein
MKPRGGQYYLFGSEAIMRLVHLLLVSLVLGLCACGGKVNHAPPPLKQELLIGKWKQLSNARLITGYEFKKDGTFLMSVKGMDKKVPGTFSWTGDRTIEMVFKDIPDELKKGYTESAKGFREDIEKRVKNRTLNERAVPSMLSTVRDELPTREELQVSLTEQPRELGLTNPESGTTERFEKAD